jgi:hypothetical protein
MCIIKDGNTALIYASSWDKFFVGDEVNVTVHQVTIVTLQSTTFEDTGFVNATEYKNGNCSYKVEHF